MKIYIAGRITGNENAEEEFRSAELWLLELGHVPLNPMKNIGFDYKEYIDMGLMELSKCDAIFLLNEWEDSQGAVLEYNYACTVGILLLYQSVEEHSTLLEKYNSKNIIEHLMKGEDDQWELEENSTME